MRLLNQARVDAQSGGAAVLEWRLKPASEAGGSESVGDTVRFNFRAVSGANPMSLSGFRRQALPEKITNRGV
jgi:type VI secretion system protein ImpL